MEETKEACMVQFKRNEKDHEVIHKRIDKYQEKIDIKIENVRNETERKISNTHAKIDTLVDTLQTLQSKMGGFIRNLLISAVIVLGTGMITLCIWIIQFVIELLQKKP